MILAIFAVVLFSRLLTNWMCIISDYQVESKREIT